MVVKKVMLWSSPRSLSTAFERSMMEIKNCQVHHEPFLHLGSYDNVIKSLTQIGDGIEYLFVKALPYAIQPHFSILLHEDLRDFKHAFLIRDPRKLVPSLYKAHTDPAIEGYDHFDPAKACYEQLVELYNFVEDKLGQNSPVVINANDLQTDPKQTMKGFCESVELPFTEDMLHWEPIVVEQWSTYIGWHKKVLQTTGFEIQDRDTRETFEDLSKFPKEVANRISECLPFYDVLNKKALRV